MSRSLNPILAASELDNYQQRLKENRASNPQNDLKEASAKNPSILLELNMDGEVVHLSKSWEAIVGTDINKIVHRLISNIIKGTEEDKKVFIDAINCMMTDNTSYRVRFVTSTNNIKPDADDDADDALSREDPADQQAKEEDQSSLQTDDESLSSLSTNGEMIELEGQGILIHDSKNIPTHSMWILKPFNPNSLNVKLPAKLAESLGFGANIFSSYLATLSEAGIINEEEVPPPPQVLCRICEQQVPSWWLEKHSELCFNEHKCESDVQIYHDMLVEQKQIIDSITESLNKESLNISDSNSIHDYKGLPLPKVVPSAEAVSSPVSKRGKSGSLFSTLRFPFKTLALLSELCDHALQINPSEFIEEEQKFDFSPNTKDAIFHVTNSQLPSSSDPAINFLSTNTSNLTNAKVNAVTRMKSSLLYSQKIKEEIDETILLTIREAIKNIRNQTSGAPGHHSFTSSASGTHSTETFQCSESSKIVPLAYPRPTTVQSNIFTDAYLDTDVLPSSSPNILIQNIVDLREKFSPARSITPRESTKDGKHPEDMFHSFEELRVGSPIMTPQRKPSPGLPQNFHNSPMSSIQRNSKFPSFEAHSITPVSSPLLLAHETSDHIEKRGSSTQDSFLSTGITNALSGGNFNKPPLSPLLSAVPGSKSVAPSIKDYEILKPISKGAFGSVYLARRKVTGDYFAIKVLKKADMIAKNQVTNIKAERAIMMVQSDSPYVAKLYSSFQSKDFLYLVMEYLPGGDCASLIGNLNMLPDEWAKTYIAQVIVGVADLHQKGIVHHDLKPDNLLIDSKGHLKLTDFGLSRMGLIRRQERIGKNNSLTSEDAFFQPTISTRVTRKDSITALALSTTSPTEYISESSSPGSNYFDHDPNEGVNNTKFFTRSDSQGSVPGSPLLKPLNRSASQTSFLMPDEDQPPPTTPSSKNYVLFDPENSAKNKKFVGTPDYLSPETIAGTGETEASDWWSVGCILFEFLFGYPPFHDMTPEKVFENILNHRIDWPSMTVEEELSYCSPEAKDLIKKLLIMNPDERLGASGSDEIKAHPYFHDIDWDTLWSTVASFVPAVENPEDTDYFDPRGADLSEISIVNSDLENEELSRSPVELKTTKVNQTNTKNTLGSPYNALSPTQKHLPLAIPLHMRERRPSKLTDGSNSEFGSFQFRNLPALDKANKDVIKRIKAEHLEHRNSVSSSSSESCHTRAQTYSTASPCIKRSLSPSASMLGSQSPVCGSFSSGNPLHTPSSVATNNYDHIFAYSENSGRSSPSTDSGSPSTKVFTKPQTPVQGQFRHTSRGSRGSKGSILLQRSFSEFSPSSSDNEDSKILALERVQKRRQSSKISEVSGASVQILDVLLCEPIPIIRFQLKKYLESLGCAVVAVAAGDELVRRATGEVQFDVIITALKIPRLEALDIVKLLKYTSSSNSDTPIIAVTAYYKEAFVSGVFTEVLEKPISKKKLQTALEKHCHWKLAQSEEAVSDSEELSDVDNPQCTIRARKM